MNGPRPVLLSWPGMGSISNLPRPLAKLAARAVPDEVEYGLGPRCLSPKCKEIGTGNNSLDDKMEVGRNKLVFVDDIRRDT